MKEEKTIKIYSLLLRLEESPPAGDTLVKWFVLTTIPVNDPASQNGALLGFGCAGGLKTGIGCLKGLAAPNH